MLYVFLDCELDTHLHTLRRAGKTTRLRPKVFQFLQHLIEQRERVVSKHELIERFWPKPFVSDAAVEGTIRDVRRAVGDSRNSQHIIQTLPGHGYRFIAHLSGSFEVRERPGEPQQAEASGPSAAVTGSATEAVGAGADGWTCAVCYHVMPPGYSQDVRFCLACGAELGSLCLDCGFRNQPRARFCVACGSPLADALPSGEASPTSRTGAVAEQRQLTVLSCELVGALRLSQRLGLEAYREVIRAYRAVCAEVIGRYEGYRAPYLSDGGVLAYFGWPQAHDDDAQRAVRAGLGLVDALGALNDRLAREHDTTVALRVGIHTGPVVVEDVPDGESSGPLALGEPPYVATQLRDLAAPNTVVMSTDTAELVQGYFVWQEVAPHAVEGRAEPVGVVRVLRPSGAQSRLDTAGPRGLTPLVGRETEVPLLLERWSRVMEGAGQAVLLSGEAGIGKSRLAQVVKDHVPDTAALQLECRCSPYDQHSALYPVITLVHQLLAWDDLDTPAEKLKRLETVLTRCALPLGEMVPLLAALLSLPVDAERYPPPLLSRQQQRQQTLHAILALVLALAAEQPVVLIVEDLHWIDPSTLEWLSLLVEQLPTVPVYALFTYRPVFRAPWGPRSYVTPVVLQRLPREQVALMVTRVTGGKPVPDEVLRQIVAKTDGVPLFVEELTKAVLELGLLRDIDDRYELTASLPDLAIPVTLHDSLMARLDRLGLAKGVAQLGATLGRQFSAALLQAVWQEDETALQRGLERLVTAELLYQKGMPPQTSYVFKHALVQETAYQSLLPSTRRHYHRRVAQILKEDFPDTVVLQPELLAHHYTEAGLSAHAIPFWQRAGEQAVERSANVEAIRHFRKGLELLDALPDTPERVQQRLTLQLAIGAPLIMCKGHSAPEVEETYSRAYDLCQRLGDSPQRFRALAGLCHFYLNRARLRKTHEIGNQCFTLARRLHDAALLQEAHAMLGTTLLFLGQWAAARPHLEQGMALYEAAHRRAVALSSAIDPGVVCLARGAWTLWMLGYPEQALARARQAQALAQSVSHVYSLGFAQHYLAVVHQCRREFQQVQQQAEVVIALGHERAFVQWLAGGMCMRGWALAEQGVVEEGIAQLQEGMALWRRIGTDVAQTHMLLRLAEAYEKGGRVEAGLQTLEEALAVGQRTSERYYEAELHRLQGELLLRRARSSRERQEAEACLVRALEVARRQQARSLELRAAMSLSRVWGQQPDQREAARAMLGTIYAWFTEGFETPDLQEAKALLAS